MSTIEVISDHGGTAVIWDQFFALVNQETGEISCICGVLPNVIQAVNRIKHGRDDKLHLTTESVSTLYHSCSTPGQALARLNLGRPKESVLSWRLVDESMLCAHEAAKLMMSPEDESK